MYIDLGDTLGGEFTLAVSLFEEMTRLRKVWEEFHPKPPLKRSDLAMLGIVSQFSREGDEPVTVSRIATYMQQSRPGVSQKISWLEKMGYLQRIDDEVDRRMANIVLTEEGRALTIDSMREFLGRMELALADMGPQKTEQLVSLMGMLRKAIEKTASV